ncbi:E3 ubiquitin ligase BIG BROTHER-related -like protein [Gossypium arboreum]|uniref:E3 ubiquitin ligase BIG BROTHER-related-like protein n=1 Tax=Gossypium arboreum TaxID=29729 RepID=A0A0B0PW54_GOSAR|nr:E3 ubiquitin ligase BIG BROTHER-related -like protein [Gossypium arboreum]
MSAEQKEQEPNPNPNGCSNGNENLNTESEHEERQEDRQEHEQEREQPPRQSSTRTPFTNLSQVDADLALARTLQEQDGDEDNNPSAELDPAAFSSDEAFARALQDAEEREMAARLLALAGINDREIFTLEDHGGHSQDTWEEVDPDELSYEELLALGEVVGTESRGLSADSLASLPSIKYKAGSSQTGSNDSCVICRVDYDDGDSLTVLSCKHSYHPECINNWLKINKVCPVCSAEVSTSGQS